MPTEIDRTDLKSRVAQCTKCGTHIRYLHHIKLDNGDVIGVGKCCAAVLLGRPTVITERIKRIAADFGVHTVAADKVEYYIGLEAFVYKGWKQGWRHTARLVIITNDDKNRYGLLIKPRYQSNWDIRIYNTNLKALRWDAFDVLDMLDETDHKQKIVNENRTISDDISLSRLILALGIVRSWLPMTVSELDFDGESYIGEGGPFGSSLVRIKIYKQIVSEETSRWEYSMQDPYELDPTRWRFKSVVTTIGRSVRTRHMHLQQKVVWGAEITNLSTNGILRIQHYASPDRIMAAIST